MFKDSMQGVSNLSFALFASLEDMVRRNTFEMISDTSVQFIKNGDIYIPYTKKYNPVSSSSEKKFSNFIPGHHEGNDPVKDNMCYFQDFKREYIERNITTVSYNKSISISSMLEQIAKEQSTYGVVLQYKNSGGRWQSFNPLHPMVAFLIMAGLMELPEEGKLHLFEFKSSQMSKATEFDSDDKKIIDGFKKDYERFFEIAPNIHKEPVKLKQSATISQSTVSDIIDDPFVENIRATVEIHKDTTSASQTEGIKSIIVPNHLIMDGTASPYYGIATVTSPSSGSMRGLALGPMATGNISLYHNEDGRYRTYSNFYETASDCNVCTGSESSSTPKGWFTLSKVNLDSMYYSDVIDMNHVFTFIQASKEVSAEVWELYNKEKQDQMEKDLKETEVESV